MKLYVKIYVLCILWCSNISIEALTEKQIDHQVTFFLKKASIKNKKNIHHKIHEATYQIKQLCKKQYDHQRETNQKYPRRSDSVFFVHFDHQYSTWTLYKPAYIQYASFVTLAKKIYAQYGLQVIAQPDQLVTIAKKDVSVTNQYLTLDELQRYKKMSDEEITEKINHAEKKDSDGTVEQLKTIRHLKKSFFWHLQIPTTGILPSEEYDIDDQCKPLAWHFLLWDIASKKGEGAKVAIIDTGASAFDIKEKDFADSYKKNINITVPDTLQHYGYNLVSEHGLDPIRQIAINFGHYCDHAKFNSDELMKQLPDWIIDCIKNKKIDNIRNYFIKNAKIKYLNKQKNNLNAEGEKKLQDLLYGKYGIVPCDKDQFFHVVTLQEPYNDEVLLETLPTPKIIGTADPFAAGHGTFTQGVVNGKLYSNQGIAGLAPQADVTMIKAFNDNGTTNKTTLNAALQRALTLKSSIVSMSLKITDEIDPVADAPLKGLIDRIDYVVAASGNDGNTKDLAYKEAYPAKFDSVAFDVGAFAYDDGNYSICSFTQKEEAIGPKFVAPGSNIFSAGLTPNQTEDSMYVFMTGTSIAVPIITGFVALVLGEFQDIFTREQILKVIYTFSMKLNNDELWQKYIKVGTPDMRSCMLCFKVLQSLRTELTKKTSLKYVFDKNFDALVQAIHTINYYVPTWYEKQLGHSFTQDFSHFQQATQHNTSIETINFYQPTSRIDDCIRFIQDLIIQAIDKNKSYKKIHGISQEIYNDIAPSLRTILFNKQFHCFNNLSASAQHRIKLALH